MVFQNQMIKNSDKVEIHYGGITMEMIMEILILAMIAGFGLFLGKQLHWAVSMTIAVLTLLGVSFPDVVLSLLPAQSGTEASEYTRDGLKKQSVSDEDEASTS